MPAGSSERRIGLAKQRQISAEPPRQPIDRLLLNHARCIRRGHQFGDHSARNLERLLERENAGAEVPDQTRGEHDQKQARHDGEINLKIEASHCSRSCRGVVFSC